MAEGVSYSVTSICFLYASCKPALMMSWLPASILKGNFLFLLCLTVYSISHAGFNFQFATRLIGLLLLFIREQIT